DTLASALHAGPPGRDGRRGGIRALLLLHPHRAHGAATRPRGARHAAGDRGRALALRGHGAGHPRGEPAVRAPREPHPAPRLHHRDLRVLRPEPPGVLGRPRRRPPGHRRGERDCVLRLVQRLQPVRHDGVLGAHGGPVRARAEQAALRGHLRGRHPRGDRRSLA
ncbi:MAG: Putative inner membrane protein, partial [uncultured Gemmatimonadetes bacterium]